MKKTLLFALPMLGLGLLASCNGVNYQVNEEEFNNAITFKDIKYVQSETKVAMAVVELSVTASMKEELSPTIYHEITETTGSGLAMYVETYVVKKEDGTYDKYQRSEKDKPFPQPVKGTAKDFITPQDIGAGLLKRLQDNKINYNSFTFNKEKNTYYSTEYDVEGISGIKIHTAIQFNNKKIASFAEENKDNAPIYTCTCEYNIKKLHLHYLRHKILLLNAFL